MALNKNLFFVIRQETSVFCLYNSLQYIAYDIDLTIRNNNFHQQRKVVVKS